MKKNFLTAYGFTFLVLTPVCWAFFKAGVPLNELFRDPLSTLHARPYIGFFSNVGILIWSFAAAICLFSYRVLRPKKPSDEMAGFLLFSGLFTLILLLDDFFLLHEKILPRYFGVPEKLIYGVYFMLFFFYLWRFKKVILKTPVFAFLVSLCFFALSVSIDLILRMKNIAVEDSLKLFGIVGWFAYFGTLCENEIRRRLAK